ncbi:hypothetical protein [Methanoplanus limicola]|uniref:hypothetical protein n=1 Tax=Methanoplanus limicola TaxID=2315 RepID=UPI001FDEA3B3|nr:hypothetical protein [Methanoplanus limicola]
MEINNETLYIPELWKQCTGFCSLEVELHPSPKFHSHRSGFPLEVSLNCAAITSFPQFCITVKSASRELPPIIVTEVFTLEPTAGPLRTTIIIISRKNLEASKNF